ncbi:MAG: GNAT family N-acetyltransferase [Deltaproteobacteria bacterium]|nr:GNAT family N-acetyltransferase [Kofleriaceae bacterium]
MARLPASIPTLTTARLRLRAFAPGDAAAVTVLAGDAEVSRYLLHVPHPYPTGLAEEWIASHRDTWTQGQGATWAVTRSPDGAVVGTTSLRWVRRHDHAELGYWLGREHWGHGYALEAAAATVAFAFTTLGCARVFAQHLGGNERSAKVLARLGMTAEGVRRAHIKKQGAYHDTYQFGVLREEFGRGTREVAAGGRAAR